MIGRAPIRWVRFHNLCLMRTQFSARVIGLGLVLAPVCAMFAGIGSASAESVSVDPRSVVAGGTVTVTGSDWQGEVEILFIKGNVIVRAGTVQTDPNGGPITTTKTAPTDPGEWTVCAKGMSLSQQQQVSTCANLTVTAPATTTVAASTTTRPATTTVAPTTVAESTTLPSSTSSTSTTPAALVPAELPLGPDGVTDVEEEQLTKEGSGLTGLAIGIGVGIIVLTGIAVVGLSTSTIGARPRPRIAIATGIVGVLIAGGSAVVMPPPKVNVPKLELSRVQASATLKRGASLRTITAECPSGQVIVGGGFASNWDSTNRSDSAYLVNWLETETRNSPWVSSVRFVLPFSVTQTLSPVGSSMPTPPSGVASKYWNVARVDGTVHLSDQVWDSKQESAASANERDRRRSEGLDPGEPTFIASSADVAAAAGDYFYMLHDAQATSREEMPGLHVTQSKPEGASWVVTAELSKNSLMPEVSISVVAVCAPDANNTDEPGVIGAHVVGGDGASSVTCPSGEVVTSAGWGIAPPGYVRAVKLSGSTVEVEGGSAYAVCIRPDGIALSSGTGRADATTAREGSGTAACPAGSKALGGVLTATFTHADGRLFENLPQNVVAAAPVGSGFDVTMRGVAEFWPVAKAGAPGVDRDQAFRINSYDEYEKLSTTSADITAICGRRVP